MFMLLALHINHREHYTLRSNNENLAQKTIHIDVNAQTEKEKKKKSNAGLHQLDRIWTFKSCYSTHTYNCW